MIKTPEFDNPRGFGTTTERLPIEPGEIRITVGAEVQLRYKGKSVAVRVTRVIEPQSEFEGMIEAFDFHELEHEGLAHGEIVRLPYDKIEHIYKWIEKDQD